MSMLPKAVVEKFCGICDWTRQVWLIQRALFEENPRAEVLKGSQCVYLLERLNLITQEYALQQLAKLHDPAEQGRGKAIKTNLSLAYVAGHKGWDVTTTARLADIKKSLDDLAAPILVARHKILSPNDFDTHLNDRALGAFPVDNDERYFVLLREFVDLVHDKVIGGPFPFDDLLLNDVDCFVAALCGAKPHLHADVLSGK